MTEEIYNPIERENAETMDKSKELVVKKCRLFVNICVENRRNDVNVV